MRRLSRAAELGGRRGYVALQLNTLRGLVAAATPAHLKGIERTALERSIPDGHPWARQLAGRPGLTQHVASLAARAHEARLAGASLDAMGSDLRRLVESGFACPDYLDGAARLLESAPPPGARFAVGFAPAPFTFLGGLAPLDRALLQWFDADFLPDEAPGSAPRTPLAALLVPDVAAEARAVVSEAQGIAAGTSILVLAADGASQERIQAALRRNGLSVADDDATPLSRHSLVATIAPLVPLFGARGEGQLEAEHLLRLLTSPVLARTPPAGKEVAVPGPDGTPRASTRIVRELLGSQRRARGTLDEWLSGIQQAERRAEADHAASGGDEDLLAAVTARLASVRVLRAQVQFLAERARGDGRLGELGKMIEGLGLSDPGGDRLGNAVVSALRREGYRPSTLEDFDEALAGSLGSGRVDRGIQMLAYEAYDGRPADLLLLTGVHQKGLGRVQANDPVLEADELELLGVPAPARALAERLALARWAASRSGRALAIVSRADASGRAVAPPVDFDLVFDTQHEKNSYGKNFKIAEKLDLAVLGSVGSTDVLTRHVDAEWVRRGAAFSGDGEGVEKENGDSLAAQLKRDLPRIPEDLLPMLGGSGAYPEADGLGLRPNFVLSASRLNAFMTCLFRAYCDSVLKLKKPEELTEDLDPKEVGSAVHKALERALADESFLVPEEKLSAHRARLVAKLEARTREAVAEATKELPENLNTRQLELARDGVVGRWNRNWRRWVAERVRAVEDANEKELKSALEELPTAVIDAATDALAPEGLAKSPRATLRKGIVAVLRMSRGNLEAFLGSADALVKPLAAKNQGPVLARLESPEGRSAIAELCRVAAPILGSAGYNPSGDLDVVGRELAFGRMPRGRGDGQPLELSLGREPVQVRGSIDLVLRRKGAGSSSTKRLEARDYKTGVKHGTPADLVQSLKLPQLALYALVLEGASSELLGEPGPVIVERIALDFVKKSALVTANLSPANMVEIRKCIGEVLDLARKGFFPPLPLPSSCPLLVDRGAYCDFEAVCRLRTSYAAEPSTSEDAE